MESRIGISFVAIAVVITVYRVLSKGDVKGYKKGAGLVFFIGLIAFIIGFIGWAFLGWTF